MIYLIIYLIGFLINYYWIRYDYKNANEWNWENLIIIFFSTLLFWYILIPWHLILNLILYIKNNISKEPPKWL